MSEEFDKCPNKSLLVGIIGNLQALAGANCPISSSSGWEAVGVMLGWEIGLVGGVSAVIDSILQY